MVKKKKKNPPAIAGDSVLIPGLGRSLEEGNSNYFNILAWEIPWMEELGGLGAVGSQRVRHELATKQQEEQKTSWPSALFPLSLIMTSCDFLVDSYFPF